MMRRRWIALGAVGCLAAVVLADERRPPREARSANHRYILEIQPGRPGGAGRVGRDCRATLRERAEGRQASRRVWERAFVNDVAPQRAYVRDDGRFVVTLDEARLGGARHALVIYGQRGELLRHFVLTDLLGQEDWPHVQVQRPALEWLRDASCRFDDPTDEFVIELNWGRVVRIDLKTLQVVSAEGWGAALTTTGVPEEMLRLLMAHVALDTQPVASTAIAELSPADQARADAVTEALTATTEPAAEGATFEEIAVPPPPDAAPEPPVAPAPSTEVQAVSTGKAAPRFVPAPDPADRVDYVAWLNELGVVEGPDAAPLYDAAVAAYVDWEGDGELLRAAAQGDPDALASPEIAAWLEANFASLDMFREASRMPAKGWKYHSATGRMLDVLLPDLSPTRGLARASVVAGRQLAAVGETAEAAALYLDTLAAGAHTGDGFTLIENLVGVAMQDVAAEALLDLQTLSSAATLDQVALAAELEAAYRPTRPAHEAMEGERAFFLDTVQQMWDADPDTGDYVFNEQAARQLVAFTVNDPAEAESFIAAAEQSDFPSTVQLGEAYFDALEAAAKLPYPQAAQSLRQLENWLASDRESSPLLQHMVPALTRYHFIKTRAETTRRAVQLVTHLQAYRQQTGSYPESLDALGDAPFAIDPFSGAEFTYRVEADDFVLYSTGGNTLDDGGRHDPKGDTHDMVFWPRPAAR